MRSSTLLALFVCIVFVSSDFRTAFGQDEEGHVAPQNGEGLDEAPLAPQEPSENNQAAPGEQEVSGKLQADPDGHSRTELVDSAEDGEGHADKKDSDVEHVENIENLPENPEKEEQPDMPRSGNLDVLYGKRSLYTVAGENCVCRSCSCKLSVRVKNMIELIGRKIWRTFPDSANKASFV
jgi:hypothetical protein